MGWLDEAKTVSLMAVADELDLFVHQRSVGPCPGCGEERRGRSDKRFAIGVKPSDDAWSCFRCGSRGDTIDLVSFTISGSKFMNLDKEDKFSVRAWFEDHGLIRPRSGFRFGATCSPKRRTAPKPPKAIPVVYPDRDELRDLWARCTHPIESRDPEAQKYLRGRGYSLEVLGTMDVCRILPRPNSHAWPKWWHKGRSYSYRAVTLGFSTKDGRARGLHGRSVTTRSVAKTRWHDGTAKGLVFANPAARVHLAKRQTDCDTVVVVEGVTDFWTACQSCYSAGMPWLVFGCTSGTFVALGEAGLPQDLPVLVCTDPDKVGKRYAQEVANALPDHRVIRVPLGQMVVTGAAHGQTATGRKGA
jgi:hypothetical protein